MFTPWSNVIPSPTSPIALVGKSPFAIDPEAEYSGGQQQLIEDFRV